MRNSGARMIGLSRAPRVYAYAAPVDMRKAYEGLSAIARNELQRDVLQGELFLFAGKTRRRAKILLFDGTGLALYCSCSGRSPVLLAARERSDGRRRAQGLLRAAVVAALTEQPPLMPRAFKATLAAEQAVLREGQGKRL